MTYLAVPDILEAQVRAEGAGGEILRPAFRLIGVGKLSVVCLLYTSDAVDDLLCVELGGRRIIKKKKQVLHESLPAERSTTYPTHDFDTHHLRHYDAK